MTQPAFRDDMPTDEAAEYHPASPLPTRLFAILIIGLAAILLAWSLRPAKRVGPADVHPSVGRAMQSFELVPLVGDTEPVTLESLRGEVVLINFWGTWCGYCLLEFPHLVEINDRLKSEQQFRFVPVSCGPGGADIDAEQLRAATEAYLTKFETDLDVYSDPGGGTRQSLMNSAQLPDFGFPTTLLLGRDGTIQGLWQGYYPGVEAEMEAAIKGLMKSSRSRTGRPLAGA
ncbi:MAG: TlpA disulfide reductase family protein [Planctomycetota bacterium]|nr:TlpA disulfide reductase family protein [Planctomycetota bacterium]